VRRRAALLLAVALLPLSQAAGYYHFIHYTRAVAPFLPIPEKFDLSALPNKTVTFVVSEAGPAQYLPDDSFASVLGAIRQAAQIWNNVESSDLRVGFGGLGPPGAQSSTPGGEIVFEELPPGVLGFGSPTALSAPVTGAGGSFVPIVRAVIRLNRDLTRRPGPSSSDIFLATVVHEMGHALGLQHTLTSSAMSTAVTRATSRAQPLAADDIAAISALYPGRGFGQRTGSISGNVSSGGQGVHLASVVALEAGGAAVSALTNPDGSYRIDGLPPGQYHVYVHPLPPAAQEGFGPADIVLPQDPEGRAIAASPYPIDTVFFPGTRDLQAAATVAVAAAGVVEGIHFTVERRPAVRIFDVATFSFFGSIAARPAYLNSAAPSGVLVARGAGITTPSGAAPGLDVQVLRSSIRVPGIRPYNLPQTNLAVDLAFGLFSGTGPRHLVFSLPEEIHVLPAGMQLVNRVPPSLASLTGNPDGTVTLSGNNFSSESQFLFDSLPAVVRGFSAGETSATAIVTPPAGASGQRAQVTIHNPDGQSSALSQAQAPVHTYELLEAPSIVVTPAALPAGVEAMVEISGVNTRFIEGQTVLGFGASDVYVRRVAVASPTRLLANVLVLPAAPLGPLTATAITGFQVVVQPAALQVLPARPGVPLVNPEPSGAVFAGGRVTLQGSNLLASETRVIVSGIAAQVIAAAPNQVTFRVPLGLAPGPAVLRLSNGVDEAHPVLLFIGPVPAVLPAVEGEN